MDFIARSGRDEEREHIMAKKKATAQQKKQWAKEDEETTLAPGATWMKRDNVDISGRNVVTTC